MGDIPPVERPITVAVVDGNPRTRLGLIQRLGQMPGLSVVGGAGDADDALAVVGDRQPDVVVLDLRRIVPDGAEFLSRLASAAPQAGIVVLTAYVTAGERADLTQAGARAILLKEIDSDVLVRAIRMAATRASPAGMGHLGKGERP